MASVFSHYAAWFHYSSDRDDHLPHAPCAGHCFHHLPLHIITPNSSLTVELIGLLIATIVKLLIRTSPLHGTAANDAGVSTRKPRRYLWHPPVSGEGEFSC